MALGTRRSKNKDWHKEGIDSRFAIGLLSVFAVLTSLYLLASSRYLSLSSPAVVGSPAASDSRTVEISPADVKAPFERFASEEDFKSYLDDSKRAYGNGVFDPGEAPLGIPVAAITTVPAKGLAKDAVKNQKDVVGTAINAQDAQKYFSLNVDRSGIADILAADSKKIYFSPESQYYWSATKKTPVNASFGKTDSGQEGKSLVFAAETPESLTQSSAIDRSGNLFLAGDSLYVFKDNLISAFDMSAASTTAGLWEARVGQGSRIVAIKSVGSKLYLVVETEIDGSHPCPIKPLVFQDEPLVLGCADIQHPRETVPADTIFSVLELDAASGGLGKNFSFTADAKNSAALIFGDSVYALWAQGGDYTAFFANFLNDKCKGLLPDYLLEKAAALPGYDISLAAKELELRALLANWTGSLSLVEQKRIMVEMNTRMTDYLRTHYREFERTGIAAANIKSFEFTGGVDISGRIGGPEFVDEKQGNLMVTTVSGQDAYRKMNWLVTGNSSGDLEESSVNNVYLLDSDMKITASKENLDLPAGICAIKYSGNYAFASLCRPEAIVYILGFVSPSIGLQGQLETSDPLSYTVALSNDLVLTASQDKRKIKLAIFDVSLPAKPELRSEYELNDYWADFDGNYAAFSSDDQGKRFFFPVAKGGYVFSYYGAKLELKGAAGSVIASRSRLSGDVLYLAGDNGIEAVSVPDLKKIKSLTF